MKPEHKKRAILVRGYLEYRCEPDCPACAADAREKEIWDRLDSPELREEIAKILYGIGALDETYSAEVDQILTLIKGELK